VDFVAVDVLHDRRAVDRLLALGIRKVPVVFEADRFVLARDLDAVAEFIGVRHARHTPLAPHALIARWLHILEAAQRYVRQIPPERMEERAVAARDRSIRVLSHHLFRIAEAFLESVDGGAEYTVELADLGPQPGTYATGDMVADYGEGVRRRLRIWSAAVPGDSWSRTIQTFYGPQSVHALLERSTWHTAQHARQLIHVLERFGIAPDGPLLDEDFEGLPLPTGLFD
jgi:hypothetical protein